MLPYVVIAANLALITVSQMNEDTEAQRDKAAWYYPKCIDLDLEFEAIISV